MSPSQLLLCLALLALLCAPSVYAGAKKPAAIQVVRCCFFFLISDTKEKNKLQLACS